MTHDPRGQGAAARSARTRGTLATAAVAAVAAWGCAAPQATDRPALAVAWPVDNPANIGGYKVAALGAPTVATDGPSPALCFDGAKDGVFFPLHPFTGQDELTVQVLFKPAPDGTGDQKVIHFQDDDGDNRVMLEARPAADGTWHLRSMIRSGEDQQQQLETKPARHPAGEWHWAALTYAGGTMRHFVNGQEEASGAIKMREIKRGEMAIGTRLSRDDWFKGCIRELRFANTALPAAQLARDVTAPSRLITLTRKP